MPTLEERVSFVEGRIVEQSTVFAAIRESLASLDQRILHLDTKLDALDSKIATQFLWLVGIEISILVAFVGGLIAMLKQ